MGLRTPRVSDSNIAIISMGRALVSGALLCATALSVAAAAAHGVNRIEPLDVNMGAGGQQVRVSLACERYCSTRGAAHKARV
jgi:hypothetical protein